MLDIQQIKETLANRGYEYMKIIGEGGFSSVLLCKSLKYNQEFAIKRAIRHKIAKD